MVLPMSPLSSCLDGRDIEAKKKNQKTRNLVKNAKSPNEAKPPFHDRKNLTLTQILTTKAAVIALSPA
jgi:hypothetical protein